MDVYCLTLESRHAKAIAMHLCFDSSAEADRALERLASGIGEVADDDVLVVTGRSGGQDRIEPNRKCGFLWTGGTGRLSRVGRRSHVLTWSKKLQDGAIVVRGHGHFLRESNLDCLCSP